MQVQMSELQDRTNLIKHYEGALIDNSLKIGKELQGIHDKKLYKSQYETWDNYIESNFSFTRRYADNFMKIYEKYGENGKRFPKIKQYGMRVLILTLSVPDDYIEEMADELETVNRLTIDHKIPELSKVVKRFARQSGDEPRHLKVLNKEDRKEEHILKLKREADYLKVKYDEFQLIRQELKSALNKWQLAASKFTELNPLIKEMEKCHLI